MEKYNVDREIENRERLVQTFLIISGFLIAFSSGNVAEVARKNFYITFWFFLVTILLYYVTVSRVKELNDIIDSMALSASIFFSFLIIFYLELQSYSYVSWNYFILMYFPLVFIFTFSLISPSTSDKYFDNIIRIDINCKWIWKNVRIATLGKIWGFLKYLGIVGVSFILPSLIFCIYVQYQYIKSF